MNGAASHQSRIQKRRRAHTQRVGQKITRVEAAAEHELANHRSSQCIQTRRMKRLTRFDEGADRVSGAVACPRPRVRDTSADQPDDHSGPQGVAEDVADRGREHCAAKMNEQPDADRTQRESSVGQSSARGRGHGS